MLTLNIDFENRLKKRIEEHIEELKENLSRGIAVKDHADYTRIVGEITALRLVADNFCHEIHTLIEKR